MKIMNKFQKKLANRKKDNKGFSLVELIIVIAIMAILVGIVGTQVIPYINKSKLEKDRQIVSSYSTAAVSAYSMVAGQLKTTGNLTFLVYGTNTGDADEVADKGLVADQIKKLTYNTFPTDKFASKDGKGATDVSIEIDTSNHKVTAKVKGTETGASDIVVESDM